MIHKFKIIMNSKEYGTCSGLSPTAVAKKVVKKLCGSLNKTVKFSLKECKSGCKRVCGPYQGWMEKLDRPYKKGGKTIMHHVVCEKVPKMKGGFLGNDGGWLERRDFNGTEKNGQNSPFLNLVTIGERSKLGSKLGSILDSVLSKSKPGDEELRQQYVFFYPQIWDDFKYYIYKYVVIRKKDKSIVFRELEDYYNGIISAPFDISESKIDTYILEQLLYKIKEEIQTQKKNNEKFDAQTIVETLEKYLENKHKHLNETLSTNDFWVELKPIEDVPFLKLETSGELGTLGFGSTKEQRGFFNPQLFIKDKNNNNNKTDSIYYQYVVIRKIDKSVIFKDSLCNDIDISDIDTSILLELLKEIKKEIQNKKKQNEKFDAQTIVETLEKYLKKILNNDNKYDFLLKLSTINNEEYFPPQIKYYSVKSNLYIFFDLVKHQDYSYYKYIVFINKKYKISLKKIIFSTSNSNIEIKNYNSFESVMSDNSRKGYLILEKLYIDIIKNKENCDHPDLLKKILTELSNYISGYKVIHLNDDLFLKKKSRNYTDIIFKENKYIFFQDINAKDRGRKVNANNRGITKNYYNNHESAIYRDYYMYVTFLDENDNIIFYILTIFKDTLIKLEADIKKNDDILIFLYEGINNLCDSDLDNINLFKILYSLEKYIVDKPRDKLKSRDFYITAQQQKETIRILEKTDKTFIFFKRYKQQRQTNSNPEYILYEYAIIINKSNIYFFTIKSTGLNTYSVLIKEILPITIKDIDELLLILLYEELLKNHKNNKNKLNILMELLKLEIGELYDLKKKVEKVLKSNIKNNKITINGREHRINYEGEFTFDFFEGLSNSKELKQLLKLILNKKHIEMINNNNKKFKFKPEITSIVSKRKNNLINNQFTYNKPNNKPPIMSMNEN